MKRPITRIECSMTVSLSPNFRHEAHRISDKYTIWRDLINSRPEECTFVAEANHETNFSVAMLPIAEKANLSK